MILVPYFIDTNNSNLKVLYVFLCSGGRSVWSVEGTDRKITKMLEENGFPVKSLKRESDIIYAHIDHIRLKKDDFYMWDEIDPKTSEEDIWRKFLIPTALWPCPVFKEHFVKSANLPMLESLFLLI
jgi:hypothetical protein